MSRTAVVLHAQVYIKPISPYIDDGPPTSLLLLHSSQLYQCRKWHASRHQRVFLDSPPLLCRALWRRKPRISPTSPRRTHRPFPISTSWPCSPCPRISATNHPKSQVSCPTSSTRDSAKRMGTEASCAGMALAPTEGKLSRFTPCRRQGGLGKNGMLTVLVAAALREYVVTVKTFVVSAAPATVMP